MNKKYTIDFNSLIALAKDGRFNELRFVVEDEKTTIEDSLKEVIYSCLEIALQNNSFDGTVNDLFAIMREFDIVFEQKQHTKL